MTSNESNIIGTISNYIQDRKNKRNQIKQTDDENIKNQLKQQIIQSQIDELKKQKEIKQNQLKQKKEEIKEEYYSLNKRLINTYKRMGIVASGREMNNRYSKSRCYFESSEKNNNMPTLDILSSIIIDIDTVIQSINLLCDEFVDKATLERVLRDLISRYNQLKYKILMEIY